MHPSAVNPRLLILGTAALVGAVWLFIKKEDLQHNLPSAEIARNTDAQAMSEPADQIENRKTEQLLAEVREELIEAQRAKDAAELTIKQAREQLAMEKEALESGPSKNSRGLVESAKPRHSRRLRRRRS